MTVISGSNRALPDVVLTDSTTGLPYDASGLVMPTNAAQLNGSSGNVAAAAATVTLAAVSGKTNYLSGFQLTGGGATAPSIIALTITGVLGGTQTFNVPVPAVATTGIQPLVVAFYPPLQASAPNVAIVVSAASFGAGNTNAALNAQGFQR